MKNIYQLPDGSKVNLSDISMISKIKDDVVGQFIYHGRHKYSILFKSGSNHNIYSEYWRCRGNTKVKYPEKKDVISIKFYEEYDKLVNAWETLK
jgi:hypothetical protein